MYTAESSYLRNLIESERDLIVVKQYLGTVFFAPFVAMCIAGLMLVEMIYRMWLHKPLEGFMRTVHRTMIALTLLSLALMIFGNMFVTHHWAGKFEDSGYHQCENVVLRFNKSLLNDVWVARPGDCTDPTIHRILHDNHSRTGFDLASRYLERKYNESQRVSP